MHRHRRGPAGRRVVRDSASMIVATAPITPSAAIATPANTAIRSGSQREAGGEVEPQPHQPAQLVVRAPLGARQVPHLDAVDALGHLHDQPVDIRVGAAGSGLPSAPPARTCSGTTTDKARAACPAASPPPCWRTGCRGCASRHAASGVAGVDHVPAPQPGVVVQPHHLLRRVLQVVVHRDDVGAAGMAQPGHDRVVLAVVACVLDIDHRHGGGGEQARQTSPELSGLPSLTSTISRPPSGRSSDSASTSRPIVAAPRYTGITIDKPGDGPGDSRRRAGAAMWAQGASARPVSVVHRHDGLGHGRHRGRQHRPAGGQGRRQGAFESR